jgi:hypothetical protein
MADGVNKPMRLDTSLLDGIGAANAAAKASSHSQHKTTGTTSFTSALKAAGASGAATTSTTKVPRGEKTRPVDGHKYADIVTGPRAGLYVNTSDNKRAGEAFVLVRRNGREYHIYGTGKDRVVIGLKAKPDTTPPAKTTAPTKTGAPVATAPVSTTTPTPTDTLTSTSPTTGGTAGTQSPAVTG